MRLVEVLKFNIKLPLCYLKLFKKIYFTILTDLKTKKMFDITESVCGTKHSNSYSIITSLRLLSVSTSLTYLRYRLLQWNQFQGGQSLKNRSVQSIQRNRWPKCGTAILSVSLASYRCASLRHVKIIVVVTGAWVNPTPSALAL